MKTLALSLALGLQAALVSPAARADATAISPSGFLSTWHKQVHAPPQQVFDAIGKVDKWWNGDHTYSGDAANLHIGMNAGDCFCERWKGNSVQHAQVIYVSQGAAVRMLGALGPLQEMAVNGVLTFDVAAVDGKTMLTVTYRVSGAPNSALDKFAEPVDRVLGEQASRLVAWVETGSP